MRLSYLFLCLVLSTPAVAQDWALRAGDRVLSHEEVEALTSGQTLVFYDDGRSMYSAGGAYSYTYASGAAAFGHYEIRPDGTVCIAYVNGFGRCDRYVEAAGRIVLLTEKGLRFPVRPRPSESPRKAMGALRGKRSKTNLNVCFAGKSMASPQKNG